MPRQSRRLSRAVSSVKNDHVYIAKNLEEIPHYFDLSIQDDDDDNNDNTATGKEKLCDLIIKNERLLNELFHLQYFTSLVYFNPENILQNRQTENFNRFKESENYNIWESNKDSNNNNPGRSSRRVQQNYDPLRVEVDKLVENKLEELFNDDDEQDNEIDIEIEEDEDEEEDEEGDEEKDEEENSQPEEDTQNEREIIKSKTTDRKRKAISKPRGRPPSKKATATKLMKSKVIEDLNTKKKIMQARPGRPKKINKVENDDESTIIEKVREIKDEEEPNSDDDDGGNNSSKKLSQSSGSNISIPKILKLKFTIKPQIITHPDHIPKHEFDSIDSLFDSYKSTIEEPGRELPREEFDQYLNNQSEFIKKVKIALDDNLLRLDLDENVFRNVPSGTREPTMIKKNSNYSINHFKPSIIPFRMKNELTHYDHLLAQGIKSSKLIKDSRNQKIQKCRRISQMIEIHFKKLSQEKEKHEKEFEKKIFRLARDTAKEVKKKWLVAVKAYKILEEREKEKERVAKSKEQLSKILDHSTKVLGAQLAKGRESVEASSPKTGEEIEDEDVNMSSSSDDDDDNNASDDNNVNDDDDDDDDDDDGDGKDDKLKSLELDKKKQDDDSKLSLKELKEKYKNLDNIEFSSNSRILSPTSNGLGALYDKDDKDGKNDDIRGEASNISIVDQLTVEERKKLVEDESHNPMLSESDEDSLNSDDSMSISDSDADSISDSNHSDSESVSEEEETSAPGLGSLLDSKPLIDSDDESVYSENNNDQETPTSSPEQINDENTTIPDVPVPILLKGTLRPYQKQGLNWLASLYNNGTNGILADEMGLGKTIQTISLISYLACEKNIWGPHLIVVPTSVMLNWEMEFKRFAPGFKVLTYYGSPQQRKEKRRGWNTPDTFHVCITSYQLVVQDHSVFRRKKWKYMILDEAHNIKNFRSQRWKSLLNFNTENRLLLTGTPLQNNIIELWSLLYFLMPSSKSDRMEMPEGFADLMNFQQWFGRPVDKIIQGGANAAEDNETKETVNKLHQVLRPYLLRRLKQDVEKQMPAKYEHIVYCRLSKRQRLLYDDFMSRAQTKETLASGNFLSIINCLMQLRKVCNHPDLFEVRPILTSFAQQKSVLSDFSIKELVVRKNLKDKTVASNVDLKFLNLLPIENCGLKSYHLESMRKKSASSFFEEKTKELLKDLEGKQIEPDFNDLKKYYEWVLVKERTDLLDMVQQRLYVNNFNCNKSQLISSNLIDLLKFDRCSKENYGQLCELDLIKPIETRALNMSNIIEKYAFVTPKVVAEDMKDLIFPERIQNELLYESQNNIITNPLHQAQIKTSIAFPDKSLLQYDCGKLQKMAILLQDLIPNGHRVLIFTQMSKVLDILEKFLNYNGYTYMRLDGATKIEDRQLMTERFNKDPRVKCFILSTRSGGLGINLTGADTVIFYDSDWNPAMDKQCQDRCHRIGQTRDVHIYRFVSEFTIESNILKKANQKRQLDNVVIQKGDFTTDYFSKITVQDLLGNENENENEVAKVENRRLLSEGQDFTKALEQAEDVEDSNAAKVAMKEVNIDTEDFDDNALENNANKEERNASTGPAAMVDNVVASEELAERIEKKDDEEEEEEDDDVGHIDEYMIRFIASGFYFDP